MNNTPAHTDLIAVAKQLLKNLQLQAKDQQLPPEIGPALDKPATNGNILPGDDVVGVHHQIGVCTAAAMAVHERIIDVINYTHTIAHDEFDDSGTTIVYMTIVRETISTLLTAQNYAVLGADADDLRTTEMCVKQTCTNMAFALYNITLLCRMHMLATKRATVFSKLTGDTMVELNKWKAAVIMLKAKSRPTGQNPHASCQTSCKQRKA